MDNDTIQKIQGFRERCMQLRQTSPHPSRPQIPTAVDPAAWSRVHSLFQMSAIGSLPDEGDVLTALRSEGLMELCMFTRNAAAMDRTNQDSASAAGVVGDIRSVIFDLATKEITCPEAMKCVAIAAQALSNIITGNKQLQQSLMETELASARAPTETVYWYTLASVNTKTTMAGLMLVLNSVMGDDSLTKLLCSAEAGRLVANKIAEMFGDDEDDESDMKNMLYAVLSQIIQSHCLVPLLTNEPSKYGFLDALAVYCNEGAETAGGWRAVISKDLIEVRATLTDIWEAGAEISSADDSNVVSAHRCLASVVSILGSITTESDPEIAGWLAECQALHQVHLPRIERASEQEAREKGGVKDDPVKHLFMFKVIGNVAYGNTAVQDLMRDLDGLALVLDHMKIDDNHPYIKEYAVVALKGLLQDNPTSQEYVRNMSAIEALQDPQLAKAGLRTSVDMNGRLLIQSTASSSVGTSGETASKRPRTEAQQQQMGHGDPSA
ncbi:hypothetical protein GQ54DRAFT_316423 [Martensiomyces pterosporus]|nr:hypothetical protein GQ54DRAFT_316423 [Martensiomyces pterosporus]